MPLAVGAAERVSDNMSFYLRTTITTGVAVAACVAAAIAVLAVAVAAGDDVAHRHVRVARHRAAGVAGKPDSLARNVARAPERRRRHITGGLQQVVQRGIHAGKKSL